MKSGIWITDASKSIGRNLSLRLVSIEFQAPLPGQVSH
jgi:hypothetical protein